MNLSDAQQRMLAATVISLIPAGVFLFLALKQGSDALAYVRALPILALALLGWYRPQVAGWALIALAIVFATLYTYSVPQLQLMATGAIVIIFFVPIIASGYLFLTAHKQASGHSADATS